VASPAELTPPSTPPSGGQAPFGGGPLVAEPWESPSPERIGSVAGLAARRSRPRFPRITLLLLLLLLLLRRLLLKLLLLRLLLLLLSEDCFYHNL
jgi:hypothetical protein